MWTNPLIRETIGNFLCLGFGLDLVFGLGLGLNMSRPLKPLYLGNSFEHVMKGDIAYEVMGLFAEEKIDRYCKTEQDRGVAARNRKIDKDTMSICDLYS